MIFLFFQLFTFTIMLELDFVDEMETKKEKKSKNGEKKFTLRNIDIDALNTQYIKSDFTTKFQNSLLNEEIDYTTSKFKKLKLSDFDTQPNDKLIMDTIKINLYHTDIKFHKGITVCLNCNELDFPGEPLSLPFKYYPSILRIRSKIPETNQEIEYCVSLTKTQRENYEKREIEDTEGKVEKLEIREYFDADGFFCRPGCLLRFYYNNRDKTIYKNSLSLIRMMFKYMGMDKTNLKSFSDPRLLKKYGGPLTIDEYYKTITDDVNVKFIHNNQLFRAEENKKDKKSHISRVSKIFEEHRMKK
jgi:hypothetical protein